MIRDDLNKNFDIIYDHRNLIVELKQLVIEVHGSRNDSTIYKTYYYYDESGNRIRKKIYNDENDSLLKDIVYSRDLNGKEMAVYENGSIKQWNIWGMDNAGFINANGDKRYYLKDHLGSVRAVIDDGGSLVSAQDYDAWGYQLQNRSFESDVSIYKFTSKEHDEENKYDYFGARYYDARVGRWGQVEPLLDDFPQLTPYNYSLNNPIRIIDDDGNGPKDGLMYNDPGADWGRPGPGIGIGLANATRELVRMVGKAFENTSVIIGAYKSLNTLIESLNENRRLRYEFNNSLYWTEEIIVSSTMSEDAKDSENSRVEKTTKKESKVWQDLDTYKGKTKTKGKGKSKEYYEWDHKHGDIEVYDSKGGHKGSMDPNTGKLYKPPVKGRNIKDKIN